MTLTDGQFMVLSKVFFYLFLGLFLAGAVLLMLWYLFDIEYLHPYIHGIFVIGGYGMAYVIDVSVEKKMEVDKNEGEKSDIC